MILAFLASVSLLSSLPAEPPELTRTDLCWEIYDNCQREAWEDYAADAITGDQLLARWDACMAWLDECIERAQLLDALDNQVPVIPGVIEFPPTWDYEE